MSEATESEPSGVQRAFGRILAFRELYGPESMVLASHAAVLERIRPEVLALLRQNFLSGAARLRPWHDAAVLFGPLCRDLGGGFFRMEPEVRRQLLRALDVHGQARGMTGYLSAHVGRFVRHYVEQARKSEPRSKTSRFSSYLNENLWTALAIDDPDAAAAALYSQIEEQLDHTVDAPNRVRLGGVVSLLKLPLRSMRDELTYALAQDKLQDGELEQARTMLGPLEGRSFAHEGITLLQPEAVLARYTDYAERRVGLFAVTASDDSAAPQTNTGESNADPALCVVDDRSAGLDGPLHGAARADDVEAVRDWLAAKQDDIDAPGADGRTALHLAAELGHDALAALLLEAGADPDSRDPLWKTPLFSACEWGRTSIANMLIDRGAKANIRTASASTPVMAAAHYGHPEILARLLADSTIGPDEVNVRNDTGYCALMGAVRLGSVKILQMLLEAGAVFPEPEEGVFGLLHFAAAGGHPKIIAELLRQGYPVDLVDQTGWTALHITAQHNRSEVAALLIEAGADLDRPQASGWTAALIAASWDSAEVLAVLARYGADMNLRLGGGHTPLLIAALNGKKAATGALLALERTDRFARTAAGEGALELAVRSGDQETLRALLGDPAFATTTDIALMEKAIQVGKAEVVGVLLDETAICSNQSSAKEPLLWQALTAKEKNWDIVERLLRDRRTALSPNGNGDPPLFKLFEEGAEMALEAYLDRAGDLAVSDKRGQTALAEACEIGTGWAVHRLLEAGLVQNQAAGLSRLPPLLLAVRARNEAAVGALVKHGANMQISSPAGAGPLHLAAAAGAAMLKLLLPLGSDLEAQNRWGHTPLHVALVAGETDAVDRLLAEGGELEARTSDGLTPLLVALHAGQEELALELLARGADPMARTPGGWTALHMAAQKNLPKAVTALLEAGAAPNAVAAQPPLTPLQAAAEAGASHVVPVLIEAGALIDMGTWFAPSPLMLTVRSGAFDLANLLVEHGARLDILDPQTGMTLQDVVAGRRRLGHRNRINPDDQEQAFNHSLSGDKDAGRPPVVSSQPVSPLRAAAKKKSVAQNAVPAGKKSEAEAARAASGDSGFSEVISRSDILLASLSDDARVDVRPPWTQATPDSRARAIAAVRSLPGSYPASAEDSQIVKLLLPFYSGVHLVRVRDRRFKSNIRALFFVDTGDRLVWLNGASPQIHALNRELPIKLDRRNVLGYLRFFNFFVRGQHGPFYVCDSMEDEVLSEISGQAADALARTIAETRFDGVADDGSFLCHATLFYSNAILVADYKVSPCGLVEIVDDEPVAADLPRKLYLPIS